jgi:5-oxoprolinase (ATP-hydrolysing)
MEFLEPLQISLLTERRSRAPYGLAGGEEGKMGINTWKKQLSTGGTRNINLGGKASVQLGAGDSLIIDTPGGGGWGRPEERQEATTLIDILSWEARGSLAERASAEAAFGA